MSTAGAQTRVTASFAPRNPDYAQRVHKSFDAQGAMHLIGASISRLEPGLCEITLPYRDQLSQQHGYFHGGIITTIADSAAGYAAFSLVDANTSVLSVEFKVNFLAPADGDRLIARAEIIKSGRTLAVAETRVHAFQGATARLCATMHQTIMHVQGRAEALEQ